MDLKFQVQTRIAKPVGEVFDAFVDPTKLSRFFTATSSGRLEEGARVVWTWRDTPDPTPVSVKQVQKDQRIVLEWSASRTKTTTCIEIQFEALGKNATLVKIAESGWKSDDAGLESSYENCEGWTHVNHCLKAWLEHDIDLRDASNCGQRS